jgi:predicted 2-oxoglutarate/Fe(II)-dependent dioxygenase YbiX
MLYNLPSGFESTLDLEIPAEFEFEYKSTAAHPIATKVLDHLEKDASEYASFLRSFNGIVANENVRTFREERNDIFEACKDFMSKLENEARNMIIETWEVHSDIQMSYRWMFEFGEGSFMHVHSDNGNNHSDRAIIKYPSRKFTAVFYLSSKDEYTGGDLEFENIIFNNEKVRITPEKCMMVVFPSNVFYSHSVKTITSGQRLVQCMTFDVQETYRQMQEALDIEPKYVFDQTIPGAFPVAIANDVITKAHTIEFSNYLDSFVPEDNGSSDPMTLRSNKEKIAKEFSWLIDIVSTKAKDLIQSYWRVNGELIPDVPGYFKYNEGLAFGLHVDNGNVDEGYVWAPKRKFTAVFYLHEPGVDYKGGKLVFPTWVSSRGPLTLMPEQGSVVVWPSNAYYSHEVTKLGAGRRTVMAIFFDVDHKEEKQENMVEGDKLANVW